VSTSGRVINTALPLRVTEHGGEVAAETFVLVHGYAGSSFTWRKWLPELTRRGRVLTVDLKGFGDAPKPDDDLYAPGDLADLVVALVRELGLWRVTLVGHSLGGGISLLVALRLKDAGEERIGRLVLIGSPAYRQRLPPLVPLSKAPRLGRLLIRAVGAKRAVRMVLRQIVFDAATVSDEQVEAYARPLETPEGVRSAMAVGRSIVPDDLDATASRYPELDLPTLLLWGDRDPVVPLRVGQRLSLDLPRARLAIIERCGHIPPEESPEASFLPLAIFLQETP
jgi:pimeloyl-ACP methyl ester carboxylesterase